MQQTVIQNLVTKTAAFNGAAVDISGILDDWTLVVDIQASGPDTRARFSLKDNNGLVAPAFVTPEGLSKSATHRFTFRKRDFPNVCFGVAGATLSLQLVAIYGTNPSITYRSWVESAS